MTANLPKEAVREILQRCVDRSPANLRQVAEDFGLLDQELGALLRRSDDAARHRGAPVPSPLAVARPVPRPPSAPVVPLREPEPRVVTLTCTTCEQTKPETEFYPDPNAKSGRNSACRACNNRRDPSVQRMVRTRARNRAMAALMTRHREEFERLYQQEFVDALQEHYTLAAEAAAAGFPDAEVARLKPGPKRREETSVIDRLDVARCPRCHTHHDEDHTCPTCGDETPVTPAKVKPYQVRAWARSRGLNPPDRGPLSKELTAAYAAAHNEKEQA
jgi:hypothetical protein